MSHADNNAQFTFNSLKQLSQYDGTFRWLQFQEDTLFAAAGTALGTNSTAATLAVIGNALAESICGTAAAYSTGANQQYASNAECMAFLASIPFGQTYQLGMSTLQCRMLHQVMVPFRPTVHCPHM